MFQGIPAGGAVLAGAAAQGRPFRFAAVDGARASGGESAAGRQARQVRRQTADGRQALVKVAVKARQAFQQAICVRMKRRAEERVR